MRAGGAAASLLQYLAVMVLPTLPPASIKSVQTSTALVQASKAAEVDHQSLVSQDGAVFIIKPLFEEILQMEPSCYVVDVEIANPAG